MSAPEIKPAKPFSAWELGLAWRYLRARRKEGGIALIAIILSLIHISEPRDMRRSRMPSSA